MPEKYGAGLRGMRNTTNPFSLNMYCRTVLTMSPSATGAMQSAMNFPF